MSEERGMSEELGMNERGYVLINLAITRMIANLLSFNSRVGAVIVWNRAFSRGFLDWAIWKMFQMRNSFEVS